jgi:hypothetical protein
MRNHPFIIHLNLLGLLKIVPVVGKVIIISWDISLSTGHISTKMNFINLGSNEFVGEIHSQIKNITSLILLVLEGKFITREITSSLASKVGEVIYGFQQFSRKHPDRKSNI